MFQSFRKLISELGEGGKAPELYDEGDYRVAAAALLVHAAGVDGSVSEAEQKKLHTIIKQRFNLSDDDTDALVAKATEAEHDAIDLYQFAVRLNRSLDQAGRARVVEMMWQIVYADDSVTEFEDNLIWRAADLLGISRNERIALRQKVMGEKGNAKQ